MGFINKKLAWVGLVVILAAFGAFYFSPLNHNHGAVQKAHGELDEQMIYVAGLRGYQSNGLISIASTDEPAVNVGSYNMKSGKGEAVLYESNLEHLTDFLLHDDKDNQINKKHDITGLRTVSKMTVEIKENAESQLLLPLSPSGIWYLTVSNGDKTSGVYLIRSQTGAVLKEAGNQWVIWAQNYNTGRSVTTGSVKLFNLEQKKSQLAETSLNNQGLATFSRNPAADIALVQSDNDTAIVPINLHYLNSDYAYARFQNKIISTRYFLFTDRPIYRPGDTVNFKAVLREDDDAHYSLPQGQATINIFPQNDDTSPIFEKKYGISGNGTVIGSYTLPDTMATGDYSINLTLPGDRPTVSGGAYGDYAFFKVDYYRKPEYGITITTNQEEYIGQDTIKAKVSGQYFFGQPLANVSVKYRVNRADLWDYDYWQENNQALYQNDYRYGVWYGQEVKTGEVQLNDKGEAEIEIPTDWHSTKSQITSIEAEYVDDSGNPSFARKNVLVFAGEFGVYRQEGSYSGKVGETFQLPLQLISRQDHTKPVTTTALQIETMRRQWIPYKEGSNKYFSYREETENLPPQALTANNLGEASFTFTPSKPGSYEFTVQAKDARGNEFAKTFYAWIVDRDETFFGEDNADVSVRTNKQAYLPGENAEVTINSVLPDRDVLLTFERASVLRYQVVNLTGKTAKLQTPLSSGDMPNLFLTASTFTNTQLASGQTSITVSAQSQKILMQLIPDKKTLAPGETVQLTVKTTTTAGTPVAADTAVWVVDKALFELVENPLGDIYQTFWSDRYNNTETANSLQGIGRQTAEQGGCFVAGTSVLMADGNSKPIEQIKTGDRILTFAGEKDYRLVPATVSGTHSTGADGYLIINGRLKVTPNHKMWVDGMWQPAGNIQVGSQLIDNSGNSTIVSSVEWQKGKTTVYGLSIEKYQTFFTDGIWVHNNKDGGGDVRTTFKDTAYWNPSLRTNANGLATVSFQLPDNLTTWVVAGVAATDDTKVGQGTSELLVTKDIIVRPILPNLMRVGDEMNLAALVHNYSGANQTMEANLSFDSGEIISASTQNVEVANQDFAQISWRIKPNRINENAKITLRVVSKQNPVLQDTITQTLPVKPFGFMQKEVFTAQNDFTYQVPIAIDSKKEYSQVSLSLSPTLLGTLPSAMRYLLDYPFGCTEQTTSRLMPVIIAKTNPTLFSSALAGQDTNAMIKAGLIRLSSLQQADGGWSWWYAGGSDPFITAYVVDYLMKVRTLGVMINEQMLNKAEQFLNSTYDARTQKDFTTADQIAKNFALYRMGLSPNKNQITDLKGLTPDILALAVMTNLQNGHNDPNTNGVNQLIGLAKTEGSSTYWDAGASEQFGSVDASTGLALRALVMANQTEVAGRAMRYLAGHRQKNFWSNSFATAQVIQGMVDYTTTNKELVNGFTYNVSVNGKTLAQGRVTPGQQTIPDLPIPAKELTDNNQIKITKVGEGNLYTSLIVEQLRTDPKAAASKNGFTVKREYVNTKGPQYSIGVGDVVNVNITVTGNSPANYAIIADELPAGLIPINQSLRNQQFSREENSLAYYENYYQGYGVSDQEPTLNGMNLAIYRVDKGEQTYSYKARAIASGTYTAPPSQAELMYAPEVRGTSTVANLTIDNESRLTPVKAIKSAFSNYKILIGLLSLLVLTLSGLAWRQHLLKLKRLSTNSTETPIDTNAPTPQTTDSRADDSGNHPL